MTVSLMSFVKDPETLKARADRFNHSKLNAVANDKGPSAPKSKRAATVTEEVDAEEEERRKKRALRFGLKVGQSSLLLVIIYNQCVLFLLVYRRDQFRATAYSESRIKGQKGTLLHHVNTVSFPTFRKVKISICCLE